MRRTETQQWWRSEELRILLAHYLVDHGHVDTVSGLLAYYEAPYNYEKEMRACLREMAAGQLRPGVSLTQPVVDDIKARSARGESPKAISRAHAGLSTETVRGIAQGTLWPLDETVAA